MGLYSYSLSDVKKVNIDVCTVCNHRCLFCANPHPKTLKNILSVNDFRTIMSDLCNYISVRELGLSAKGEPLLNSGLEEIIRLSKEYFHIEYVYISTNGALLDHKRLNSLLDAGLDSIKFSINAFSRKEYKGIHGKDDYETVINNLNHAIDMKAQRNFNLLISSIANLSEDEVRCRLYGEIGNKIEIIDSVIKYEICHMPGHDIEDESSFKDYSPCSLIFDQVYIDANCELAACCVDYFGELRFGNIKKHSINQLWNSDMFNKLREMHIHKTLPFNHLCYRCLAKTGSSRKRNLNNFL